MKKINGRKEKLFLITFALMMFLGIAGFSLAWFSAGVFGNDTAKDMTVRMSTLKLIYRDTNIINMEGVLPGMEVTKTFSVENIGDATVTYDINLIDVINEFVGDNEFVYEITSTNGGASTSGEVSMPTSDATLLRADIDPTVKQEYTMIIKFKETHSDQNSNMGVTFSGTIQINAEGGILSVLDLEIEKVYIKNGTEYEEAASLPTTGTYTLADYDCHDRATVEWDNTNHVVIFNTLSIPAACTLWFDPA